LVDDLNLVLDPYADDNMIQLRSKFLFIFKLISTMRKYKNPNNVESQSVQN